MSGYEEVRVRSTLRTMIEAAEAGKPVYITQAHDRFGSLAAEVCDRLVLAADLLDSEGQKTWELKLPRLEACDQKEKGFVRDYLYAEVYNILSSIGARAMTLYAAGATPGTVALVETLNEAFCVDMSRDRRRGYGRSINVLDRMMAAVRPGEKPFRFYVDASSRPPEIAREARARGDGLALFRRCTSGLEGEAFCGIDVGGTDIKAVLVDDGTIVDCKEYDWFPAAFLRSRQLVEPLCLIARLLRADLAVHRAPESERRTSWLGRIAQAMDKGASDEAIQSVLAGLEAELRGSGCLDESSLFDGIGLCFPDVVVENKIVGGEVYKTRGIRNNPAIDYEADFAELTDLDERLRSWTKRGGRVRIINDGPMASFTAAVEIAASSEAEKVAEGVFAHTLGTELGTGWVTESGAIPDIPLEVYNFIVDLGSWPERAYESDDARSVNNFNTGLPGTLQKYCSQSGAFRLAMKYFPSERPDLFRELQEKGYIAQRALGSGGGSGWYVPTEPLDQRKAFLEHLMALPDREGDETNFKIWREIGESLAVTLVETRRILDPGTDERFLFGRMVKSRTCFELMAEGALRVDPEGRFAVAGTGLANTPLMRQLESRPGVTVAQFAQAVGAIYFANGYRKP
jgi:hypothetical protein